MYIHACGVTVVYMHFMQLPEGSGVETHFWFNVKHMDTTAPTPWGHKVSPKPWGAYTPWGHKVSPKPWGAYTPWGHKVSPKPWGAYTPLGGGAIP